MRPPSAPISRTSSRLEHTARKVSFWYGARSRQEVFYEDYFPRAGRPPRRISPSISPSPRRSPRTIGAALVGFIHEVVLARHLRGHLNPRAVEYYLCGPPMMIKAPSTKVLRDLGIPGRPGGLRRIPEAGAEAGRGRAPHRGSSPLPVSRRPSPPS